MASASISLPVPDSPFNSTGTGEGARSPQWSQPAAGEGPQLLELRRERRKKGGEHRRGGLQLPPFEQVRASRRIDLAKPQKGVTDLEDCAVRKLCAVDTAAVDEGAVLRANVLRDPAAQDCLQMDVRRRHE